MVVEDYVLISWVKPTTGGSEITGYLVTIRQTDGGVYTESLTDCDGSDGAIIASTSCQVQLSTLTSAPYSLSLGATVDAKVLAYNYYGNSGVSPVGSGANIVGVPDAPTLLQNDPQVTSAS